MISGNEYCGRCAGKIKCGAHIRVGSDSCDEIRIKKGLTTIEELEIMAPPAPDMVKLHCDTCPAIQECPDDIKPLTYKCHGRRNAWGLPEIVYSSPVPAAPEVKPHEHHYAHLSTIQKHTGRNAEDYQRIDEFYCTGCLDIQTRTRTHSGSYAPSWWKS